MVVGGEASADTIALDTLRDRDAASGMAPSSICENPCADGALKLRSESVWRSPSPRGRRVLDNKGRVHSGPWTFQAPVEASPC